MDDEEWRYDADEFEAEDRPVGTDSTTASADDDQRGEEGWRFSLADLDGDGEPSPGLSAEIKAGTPNRENALFVALGIVLALVIVWQLFV